MQSERTQPVTYALMVARVFGELASDAANLDALPKPMAAAMSGAAKSAATRLDQFLIANILSALNLWPNFVGRQSCQHPWKTELHNRYLQCDAMVQVICPRSAMPRAQQHREHHQRWQIVPKRVGDEAPYICPLYGPGASAAVFISGRYRLSIGALNPLACATSP